MNTMRRRPNNGGMNNNNRSGGGGNGNYGKQRRYSGGGGGNNRYPQENGANAQRERRNAQNNRDKYLSMATDALRNGDRVQAEYFYQYSDHYLRVMNSFPVEEPRQRPQHAQGGAEQHEGGDNAQPYGAAEGADGSQDHQHSDRDAEPKGSFVAGVPSFLAKPLATPANDTDEAPEYREN